MKISVVVPCYNEQEVLPQLFPRLTAAAEHWGLDFEIICVNDGSRDRTWELLQAQHQADPRWRVLSFARNFGHQAAASAGLYHARGDAVIIIDADLQDPPEQVDRLIAKWREGFHVVYAVRRQRRDHFLKRVLAWGFYRVLSKMVPFEIPADSGDFCLLDRKVVDVLNAMPERNRYLRGLRAWCGFRQVGVEFERHARAAGQPQYTFKKSLQLALNGIFSFSSVPLQLLSVTGLWISGLSLLGILFTLVQRLFEPFFARQGFPLVPGYATLVICILFLGGVQLVSLGIIGQYIGRIYDEVKQRPPWIIADQAGILPPAPVELAARETTARPQSSAASGTGPAAS